MATSVMNCTESFKRNIREKYLISYDHHEIKANGNFFFTIVKYLIKSVRVTNFALGDLWKVSDRSTGYPYCMTCGRWFDICRFQCSIHVWTTIWMISLRYPK